MQGPDLVAVNITTSVLLLSISICHLRIPMNSVDRVQSRCVAYKMDNAPSILSIIHFFHVLPLISLVANSNLQSHGSSPFGDTLRSVYGRMS